MTDYNSSIALNFKPASTGSTDIIGSLSAFAQLQQAQALAEQARANAGLIGTNTQFAAGKNQAYQRYQSLLQNGTSPVDAWSQSGLAGYPGANEAPQAMTAAQQLRGIQAYAANPNDPKSAAIGGPALENTAIANQQGLADVQKTQIANRQSNLGLLGQLGNAMTDPTPNGRAVAAQIARNAGVPEAQIQQYMQMSGPQYLAAGQHFRQAAITPDRYATISGEEELNKGNAAAATTVQHVSPGESVLAGPAAARTFSGGFTPMISGLPVGPQGAAPAVPAAAPVSAPSARAPATSARAPAALAPMFTQAEQQYGLPPGYMTGTAKVESNFDPNSFNKTSKAAGLFNFVPGTWGQYGQGSPFNPVANTDAAARLAADNQASLTHALGRPPTAGELYVAHQQGAGGAAALISNPDMPAGQALLQSGAYKTRAAADKAISSNGGDPAAPASAFVDKWSSRFGGPVSPTAFGGGRTMTLPGAASGAPPAVAPPIAPAINPIFANAAPIGGASPGQAQQPGPAALPTIQAPLPVAAASAVPQPSASVAPQAPAAPPPSGPLNPNAALPVGTAPVAAAAPSPTEAIPGQVPGGLTTVAQGLSLSQRAEQEKIGGNVGEQDAAARDGYQQAQVGQMRLQELQQQLSALPNNGGNLRDALLQPGSGAVERLGLAKLVNTALTAVGAPAMFDPEKIKSAEASQKITGQLGFATANVLGQREAASIVDQAIAQNPSILNTPQGGKFVASTINAALQRQKDYYEFLTNWRQEKGTGQGADIAFDKINPPGKYVQEVDALASMSPGDIAKIRQYAHDPRAVALFEKHYGPGMARYYGAAQ